MSDTEARSEPRLLYLVRRWFVAGRALLEDVTREHGMTAGDYTLLSFLERREPCSAADIARSAQITPQAATQQVAQLEAKNAGLAPREPRQPPHRADRAERPRPRRPEADRRPRGPARGRSRRRVERSPS
ncbi:MAG: helix-turn-helix domain-containing protein [Sphingomonas sp.]